MFRDVISNWHFLNVTISLSGILLLSNTLLLSDAISDWHTVAMWSYLWLTQWLSGAICKWYYFMRRCLKCRCFFSGSISKRPCYYVTMSLINVFVKWRCWKVTLSLSCTLSQSDSELHLTATPLLLFGTCKIVSKSLRK